MPQNHMVVAQNLGRSYPGPKDPISALEDVSFRIGQGRVVLLLGENGAGKSTLVHLACQVIRPTSGRITLGINHGFELGWCSQSQMIDWWANVFGNVYLGPRLGGQSHRDAKASTQAALRLVRLEGLADRSCDALSGGQLQRVQVARALAAEPRLLFLDEPTVGLDAVSSQELLKDLSRRAADGATVIVASHELELVERYCDEVLLLHEGHLVGHVTRSEFLDSWSNEEIAEIEFEGELDAQQLALLAAHANQLLGGQPLRAVVPRGESHRFLQAVAGMVQIRQFRLESPGLRDAFLKFQDSRAAGGGK